MLIVLLTTFLLSAQAAPVVSVTDGFGPWRLGMTREAVVAITTHGPYTPVRATGGLETKAGHFADRPTGVSFVFDDHDHLQLIQVWAYEGRNFEEALSAWHDVYRHLVENVGPVRLGDTVVPSDLDNPDALASLLPAGFSKPQEPIDLRQLKDGAKIQLRPLVAYLQVIGPKAYKGVYGSIIRHPEIGAYLVFLFVRTPG